MPRHARLILANCPHHIIQRGNNRQAVFAGDEDCRYYLDTLQQWKRELGCKVYAYCLMTSHVHLIVDPGDQAENLSLLMKRLAGRQARYVNKMEKRSGSLWEGRFKSSPINANEYLLACCRYVELNPLRAGMVEEPWQYRWSSCRAKIGLEKVPWLDLAPFYMSLGNTAEERATGYKKWLAQTFELSAEGETLARRLQASGMKTLDALYLASASTAGADYFCTCDVSCCERPRC